MSMHTSTDGGTVNPNAGFNTSEVLFRSSGLPGLFPMCVALSGISTHIHHLGSGTRKGHEGLKAYAQITRRARGSVSWYAFIIKKPR